MKRKIAALFVLLTAGTLSWGAAQGSGTQLFDARKSQRELEIMRGILSTTLEFAGQEIAGSGGQRETRHGIGFRTGVSGYYLYGQGAVFVVPVSQLRFALGRSGRLAGDYEVEVEPLVAAAMAGEEAEIAEASREIAERARELREEARELREEARASAGVARSGRAAAVPPPPPPPPPPPAPASPPAAAPATPAPPAPPAPPAAETGAGQAPDKLREKVLKVQKKFRMHREEAEQAERKLMESVAQMKAYLIEALANHGDSLTHVKPNEYVNVVLTTDYGYGGFDPYGSRPAREILSVQKSTVTDYKTGRLSLEAFRQKVLQYAQ